MSPPRSRWGVLSRARGRETATLDLVDPLVDSWGPRDRPPRTPMNNVLRLQLDDADTHAIAQRPSHFAVAYDALRRLPEPRQADLLLAQTLVEQAADRAEAEREPDDALRIRSVLARDAELPDVTEQPALAHPRDVARLLG